MASVVQRPENSALQITLGCPVVGKVRARERLEAEFGRLKALRDRRDDRGFLCDVEEGNPCPLSRSRYGLNGPIARSLGELPTRPVLMVAIGAWLTVPTAVPPNGG